MRIIFKQKTINQLIKRTMKKRHYYRLIAMAVTLSVLAFGSVKRAYLMDTKIAYADPSITYVYGTDGSEHLALNNFYPETHVFPNPSDWSSEAGLSTKQMKVMAEITKKGLNTCRVMETYCEQYDNNVCPFIMTGVAVITGDNQVIQVWNNPF